MSIKIINLVEDFIVYEIENYKKIVKTILEIHCINKKDINYILEKFSNKNFDIDNYNIDNQCKSNIKNIFLNFNLKYKDVDDIIRKEIVRYNMTMFDINCPPYLKIISCLYLKNELKTKHYYEIDEETMKKIIEHKDEQFRNIMIFKSIIKKLCDKFGEDVIFCDEYTKHYSIDSFDDMINNFLDFIKEKKSKMNIINEIKQKDFYIELSDFYYHKLLSKIILKKLPNCDYEILSILKYQKIICDNNILFNVIFNFIFNDILDKCIADIVIYS